MWVRAALTVALREPGKALLVASATGWIATGWVLTAAHLRHPGMSHSPDHFTPMWLAMILAMAPPLLLREIGHLWGSSLRRMRHLTIASFLCGYLGMWLLAGVALSMLHGWIAGHSGRVALAIVLVAIWHCSPARQRCLNACHKVPPLRVFGSAAQSDSFRYGLSTGCYCIAACSLLMFLALLVKDHHFLAMVVAAAATTLERYRAPKRPRWQLSIVRRRFPDWRDMTAYGSLSS